MLKVDWSGPLTLGDHRITDIVGGNVPGQEWVNWKCRVCGWITTHRGFREHERLSSGSRRLTKRRGF